MTFWLAFLALTAQPLPSDPDTFSSAFDNAQQRRDTAALARMLAPDFRIVHGSGQVGDRAEFLSGFADPGTRFDPFVIRDRRVVRLAPDAVLVSAEGVVRGTAAGQPFADHFRFADLFQRRGGRWWAVFTQVTSLPAP